VPNIIAISADLADSDKSEAFLKKTGFFQRRDFSGAFLQAGVSELTMAAIAVGMSLHGGVQPICSTFFAFSDYMKPVLRLAALQETRTIFFWTHDSFRVGEDGPTHQPIEQEAQLRLLEQMKNLSGRRSFLVLRPGDSEEVRLSWKAAVENTQGPTGLIFSRQDLIDIPTDGGDRKANAHGLEKGGYVVSGGSGNPALVLLANGSELGLAHQTAETLRGEGVSVQVSSIPSVGLFLEQDAAHRASVLPAGVPVLALTAGLPSVYQGLEGPLGEVFGMTRFGASANFKVLDEKFGFTPEASAQRARALLADQPRRRSVLRQLFG
jgi:transketolase